MYQAISVGSFFAIVLAVVEVIDSLPVFENELGDLKADLVVGEVDSCLLIVPFEPIVLHVVGSRV